MPARDEIEAAESLVDLVALEMTHQVPDHVLGQGFQGPIKVGAHFFPGDLGLLLRGAFAFMTPF